MKDPKESAKNDVMALFFLVVVAAIVYTLTLLPSKMVLINTIYFMVLVIVYHLYLQLRSYLSQNSERKLLNKLFDNFPKGMTYEKIHAKTQLDKIKVDRLVINGYLSKHGAEYMMGPNACHLMAAWQSEITNRQLFLLSVTILVVSIVVLTLRVIS